MATITIYLSYQAPNLMWRNSPSDAWQIMGPESATAKTTAGDTVIWEVSDDSIKKIKQIQVGKKDKISAGYKWKDIWSTKPKKDSDTQHSGVVSTSMYRGDADGYDISIQIKNGDDVTIDPEIVVDDPIQP